MELGSRRHGRDRCALSRRPCGTGVSADGAIRPGAIRENQTAGPNGLIERQVQKELLELFDIDEQTLNTEGLQITTTIDPKAQKGARGDGLRSTSTGRQPDIRTAVVSIDPRTGGVKAYFTAAPTPTVSTSARPACRPARRSRCSP